MKSKWKLFPACLYGIIVFYLVTYNASNEIEFIKRCLSIIVITCGVYFFKLGMEDKE